jgi:hypothetical protein
MKKEKDRHAMLDHQLGALFGDPASADASEIEAACEEVSGTADLVQLAYDLAARAAQQYRLAGKPVPPHVEEPSYKLRSPIPWKALPHQRLGRSSIRL